MGSPRPAKTPASLGVLPEPGASPQLSVLPTGPDLCSGWGRAFTSHPQRSPGLCMSVSSWGPFPTIWARPLSASMFPKVPRTSWVSRLPPDPGCLDPGEAQGSCLLPCPLPTWGIPPSLSLFHLPLSPTVNLQSIVTFDLTLDPGRLSPRAIFQETGTRNLTHVRELGLKQNCEAVRLLLPVRGVASGSWGGRRL